MYIRMKKNSIWIFIYLISHASIEIYSSEDLNADDEPPPAPTEVETQQSTIDSLEEKLDEIDAEDEETKEDAIENLDDEPSPENAEDMEDDGDGEDEKGDDDDDDGDEEGEDMDEAE